MRERSPASKTIRLPESLPIFPLTGVLLLPRGRLPLNIFEPRYLAMTDDALASHRMIGMVQPSAPGIGGQPPTIFQTGCAGRITSFAEEGARYLITLTGVCRFKVASEIATVRGYRRIAADWSEFEGDFIEEEDVVDRARLIEGLKAYFKHHGISTDWKSIESTPDERLVTSLAMICPFNPIEKQTLLEARDLTERAKILIGLVEMAIFDKGDDARH